MSFHFISLLVLFTIHASGISADGNDMSMGVDIRSTCLSILTRVAALEAVCAERTSNISKIRSDLQYIKYDLKHSDDRTSVDVPDRSKRSTTWVHNTHPVTGPVAFFALLSNMLTSVAVEQILVFDNIVTNVGDCYSKFTGIFTCCRAGLYVFSWNINTTNGQYVQTHLMVNSTAIGRNYAGDDGYQNTGSMTVIIRLELNEEVFVKVIAKSSTANVYSNTATSFTGSWLE